MTALVILAAVVLALLLLCQVRLGAAADYAPGELRVRVRAGPLGFQVYPRPERGKKRSRRKGPEKPAEKPDLLPLLRQYLPLIAEAAGRLRRKIRIDRFTLDFTAGAGDPASAALLFGGANALIGMLWPLVEQNFDVRERRIRTRADFSAPRPEAALSAAATLTVGQALGLALGLAPRLWKQAGASRPGAERAPAEKQKEAV